MIKCLRLKNFKPFEEQVIQFGALTLLSGLNSTGKSSVLQSLLLLRQSYQQDLLSNTGLALNGNLVNIGNAQDALFEGAKEDLIEFDITWENDIKGIWRFDYDRDADVLNVTSKPVAQEVYQSNLFSNKFHYLQAERIGPRTSYNTSEFIVQKTKSIGTKGEYTAHFFYLNQEANITNNELIHPNVKRYQSLDQPETKSKKLIDQVEAWMQEISPGTRIKITPRSDIDLVSMQYFYGDSKPYRATNVGFGISYTLPIIVSVLTSEPDTLILLENPEAHLHPKGQFKMGELLALAASCGVQIVVETHSDHVLNGIRLAVHAGKLNPKKVKLHYFQRVNKEGQILTELVSPNINRNGKIDRWPDGFFDVWDKSLEALLEPIIE